MPNIPGRSKYFILSLCFLLASCLGYAQQQLGVGGNLLTSTHLEGRGIEVYVQYTTAWREDNIRLRAGLTAPLMISRLSISGRSSHSFRFIAFDVRDYTFNPFGTTLTPINLGVFAGMENVISGPDKLSSVTVFGLRASFAVEYDMSDALFINFEFGPAFKLARKYTGGYTSDTRTDWDLGDRLGVSAAIGVRYQFDIGNDGDAPSFPRN